MLQAIGVVLQPTGALIEPTEAVLEVTETVFTHRDCIIANRAWITIHRGVGADRAGGREAQARYPRDVSEPGAGANLKRPQRGLFIPA